jgi:Ni,Fe-hydrogenase III large subunit/Ni,Fe-hydrogenase III component G
MSENIINRIKEIYPNGLEYEISGNWLIIKVKPEELDKIAKIMINLGARINHVTAIDLETKGFEIINVYDITHANISLDNITNIIFKANISKIKPEYPSIGKITWQVVWAEKEIKELLGINPIGLPDSRHQFLPYEWPNPVESELKEIPEVNIDGAYLQLKMPIKEAYQSLIPIGPYHPGVIEGQVVYVKVEGEEIVAADIKTGFHHRGIMKLIENRGYNRGIFLAERICGICSGAHGLAYITCAENLFDIEIPERALYIRTLLAEVNRIHSHLLWLGVVADVIGWKTGFMYTWGLRERILDIIESITGNRITYGIWRIGGVSRDISQEIAIKAKRAIEELKEEFSKMALEIINHPVIKSRLINVGKLTYQQAFNGGAVGPTARGSGWKIDVRKDNPPHAIYDQSIISWEIVTDEGCDSYARMNVRIKEVLVSTDIVIQCLDYLSKRSGEIRTKVKEVPSRIEAIGLNEAPRGELFYYMKLYENNNLLQAIRIRTPSYRNNALIPLMLIGCNLADVPVVMGSIDQCLACTDRIEIIRNNHREIMSWKDLVNLSIKMSKKKGLL